MKGEITLRILERLSGVAMDMADLFEGFLAAGYGASIRKIEFETSKRRSARSRREAAQQESRRYQKLLYKLKRDGLLMERIKNKNRIFSLTSQGKEKLAKLRERLCGQSPRSIREYKKEPSATLTVVIFDIPEVHKKRREWLRSVLNHLGIRLVQKSVWMGRVKIPRELINDLRDFNLLKHVEIFEVVRAGSL